MGLLRSGLPSAAVLRTLADLLQLTPRCQGQGTMTIPCYDYREGREFPSTVEPRCPIGSLSPQVLDAMTPASASFERCLDRQASLDLRQCARDVPGQVLRVTEGFCGLLLGVVGLVSDLHRIGRGEGRPPAWFPSGS